VYANLIKDLFIAMRWCVAVTAISLPALLFNPEWKLSWYPVALWVWMFVAFTALGTSIRSLKSFIKLTSLLSLD
jgi:hypothetical protein